MCRACRCLKGLTTLADTEVVHALVTGLGVVSRGAVPPVQGEAAVVVDLNQVGSGGGLGEEAECIGQAG